MKEDLRLKGENEELRKEIAFLKSCNILYERDQLEAYRFIDRHDKEFGVRWLLRRLRICPNAYYNFLKHRKADYLEREGYRYSATTIHKCINKELGIRSIVRPRK